MTQTRLPRTLINDSSYLIFPPFESFFLLLPYVVPTCSLTQSYHFTIKKSPFLLQLILKFTHFNIYPTSPTHHLCTCKLSSETVFQKNDIPTSVRSYKNLASLSRNYSIKNSFTISLSYLTPHAKTTPFTAHTSIRPNLPTFIFMFYFQKG